MVKNPKYSIATILILLITIIRETFLYRITHNIDYAVTLAKIKYQSLSEAFS